MVNSFTRCFCGKVCAICWIAIGVWAFFFLGILAILFKFEKQGNIGHFKKGPQENALVMFVTWCIYLALTIFCAINLYYRSKHPFPPNENEEEENKKKFSAIGPTHLAPLLDAEKEENKKQFFAIGPTHLSPFLDAEKKEN